MRVSGRDLLRVQFPGTGFLRSQDPEAADRGLAGGNNLFSGLAFPWCPHDDRGPVSLCHCLWPLRKVLEGGQESQGFHWTNEKTEVQDGS